MKVSTTLNNYQMGSYAYRVLSMNIIQETRVDKYHTKFVWDVNKAQFELLKKAVSKKFEIVEE